MSTAYFCTRCQRQHVRGKIHDEHQAFARPVAGGVDVAVEATPTRAEIQAAIDRAAIPGDVLPTVIVDDHVERWEAHRETQKHGPVIDRVTEAMVDDERFPPARAPKKPGRLQLWWESIKIRQKKR
ncbi:MAG: hypothetical protein Q6370_004075 [Candidatus Sigynarchaeota archaeon]